MNNLTHSTLFLRVLLAQLLSSALQAQNNLVPNPSFELINECPDQFSLISAPGEPFTYCEDWLEPNRGSSDIYHACCTWPRSVSVPDNVGGHIPAAKGNAYAGIYVFSNYDTEPNARIYREYLQVRLKEPLQTGKRYCVGFLTRPLRHNVSDSSSFIYVIQDLGVYISKTPVRDFSDWTSLHNLPVQPQIESDHIVDVTDWARVSGIYTAEGGEEWITIGNFQDDVNTLPRKVIETPVAPPWEPWWGIPHYSYYFIDEVSVFAIEEAWATSSQYWKMCADGEQLPLLARPGLDYYHWSTGDTTQSVVFPGSGTYTIEASLDGCPFMDTVEVEAFNRPVIDLGADIDLCVGGTATSVTLKNIEPLENYYWNTGSSSPEITTQSPGTYTLSTEHICGRIADTIELSGCYTNLYIPNVITPESKDLNSVFLPSGHNITLLLLEIYDHWGRLLYRETAPTAGWDGNIGDRLAEPGVYVWRLRYRDEVTGSESEKFGDVTVVR